MELRIIRTSVTKLEQKTQGSLQPLQYIVDAWADFGGLPEQKMRLQP